MARLILEDKDIKEFEEKISLLPCFAKNVSENMAVSQAIQALMNWMGTKVEQEEKKPIGGGGGSAKPPRNE